MKITLRQLQVFDAVATLGSVTSAAGKLHISQSAASCAVTDLQIVLGRQLFSHVKGRALQLTDEGKRLQPIVRSVLTEITDIERDSIEAPLSGQLLIGATATIAETVLPDICVAFMQDHPNVSVCVASEGTMVLFERLGRFELETAVIENFPEMPGIELTTWRSDEMVLVVAPDHPLAGRTALSIPDLADARWCLRESASSESARLRYIVHELIGQLPVVYESNSNWGLRNAIAAGGGIGCLSHDLVRTDIEQGRLVKLEVEGFSYTRALSLARPKAISRSRLARAFDQFLLLRA